MVLDQQEPHWHNMFNDLHYFKNAVCGDFSGGDSVVKTPHSHCMGSIPAWGTRISCAAWAQPKKKRMQSIENCIIMKSVELGLPDSGKEKKIFL